MSYYAVRKGREPGVYRTWDECHQQVNGFSGARYKKFPSKELAMDFISGNDMAVGQNQGRNNTTRKSRLNFTDSVPQTCFKSVGKRQHSSHDYKPLTTYRGRHEREGVASESDSDDDSTIPYIDDDDWAEIMEDGNSDQCRPPRAKMPALPRRHVVYTDGACENNGNHGGIAKAGVGVHWPSGIAPDIREPLPGAKQSNQRAEMAAVCRALEQAHDQGMGSIEICSDSKYTIKGVNEWMPNWKKRGWMTAANKPVENRDLWERLDRLVQRIDIKWTHVRGHTGIAGNERADLLARQGVHLR